MQKGVPVNQITPQKLNVSPIATPRKIAPHTTASTSPAKPKAKYYAANASTLPINVVQQLIATRGAKLSHGAYKQSILLIPMENEGQSRNVVSTAAVVSVKSQLQTLSGQQLSPGSVSLTLDSTTAVSSAHLAPKSSPNTLILPKPQVGSTSPVLTLAQGLPGVQIQPGLSGIPRHRAFLQPAVVDGLNVTRLVHVGIQPKSPTRYPTNETVKTLLEKRKPVDSAGSKILNVLNETPGTVPNVKVTTNQSASSQISPAYVEPINPKIEMQAVAGAPSSAVSPVPKAMPIASVFDPISNEALVAAKTQQCVITSISAAKLNTLLLQTSAAGAKSIPSLIKLPSKAALDSAVKAVVTSVNITLPTVNIKVPSPTSLPSIGPRRNVTKTIQTMKSPIPVAPKVVTQSSGGQTILSCADSHTAASSMMLTASTASALSSNNSTSASHSMQTVSGAHVQGQDGKKVLAKITPQLVLTSKGVVQMGYVSPEGLLVKNQLNDASQVGVQFDGSAAVQSGNQAVLVQNSAGQYQLIQQASPALHQTSLAANLQQLASPSAAVSQGQTMLQGVQSMVALNASGNPVLLPTVKPNPQGAANSSPPSIVLHNSTYYAAPRKPAPLSLARTSPTLGSPGLVGAPAVAGSSDLKTTTPGFIIQQPSSALLQPSPSIISQAGLVSPLLNLQQGLVLQGGGVQIAGNSIVNPVGLNLLQSGLALQNSANLQATVTSSSVNLLQKAVSATPGQQLLNINPLLLNNTLSSASGAVLNQQQNGRSVIGQVGQPITNLTSSVPRLNLNPTVKPATDGASLQIKGLAGIRPTLATTLPSTSLVSPTPQMMQVQGSSLIIPSPGGANQQLNLLGHLAATPNPAQKQLVFQYPSVSQIVTQTAVVTQLPAATSAKGKVLVSPGNKPPVIASTARLPVPQLTARNDNTGNATVAVNQVNIGQRTSPTQQKLLLFSIGGQLVTGHGVPVTLCDGVLKVVPHGKIKINNQTLSSEQIKQTLAKINEAAAMTLNPSSQQQAQSQQTGSSNVGDQSKVIPVKIVKDSVNVTPGPCVAAVDHSYQNITKDQWVTSLMNGNTSTVSIAPFQKCSNTDSNHSNIVTQNIQTGTLVMKSEPDSEPQFIDQSKNKSLVMKPMVYSSGYVVRQRNSDQAENDMKPGSATQTFNIGKLIVDKEAKGFIVKAPVKADLSGSGDASNSSQNHVIKSEVKHNVGGDDEEDEADKLVIDDSVNDKEAAFNLLTLANQALAPINKKNGGKTTS